MSQADRGATRIEPASASDVPTLARLAMHVHRLHVSREPRYFIQPSDGEMEVEFRDLMARDDARAFIAYVGDVPAGYVLAMIHERPATSLVKARRWFYVDQISVEPQWERRGIGRRLMQAAIELARSLGINEVLTDVWTFNERAQAFVESCGFRTQMARYWLGRTIDGQQGRST